MTKHTATPPGHDDAERKDGFAVVGYCEYDRNGMTGDVYCLDCADDHGQPGRNRVAVTDRPVYGGPVPHLFCDDCGDKMTGDN